MQINPPPIAEEISGKPVSWANWFNQAYRILFDVQNFGATASRPTKNLYIGQQFYDQTLGYEVRVHSVGPPAVWHNGAGASV